MALSILGALTFAAGFLVFFAAVLVVIPWMTSSSSSRPMCFSISKKELAVFAGDEGAGNAVGTHAPGAADAVHVVLGGFRYVVVDDVGYRGDVEATGGDVGGDEAGESAQRGIYAGIARDGIETGRRGWLRR